MGVFQPRFLASDECVRFGLPDPTTCDGSDILNMIDTASSMIDEFCGRTDGDGNGSLVYTTYQERILSQGSSNIYVLPHRPIVAITQATVNRLIDQDTAASGNYYTGVQPSINILGDGITLSPIIAASGRYVPGRRDNYGFSYDAQTNPLQSLQSYFGGPSTWQAIDMVNLDFDSKTGQLWLSSGLQLARYSEIIVTYNSGYDPANMPSQIKRACAALTKNLMAKGSGTTGMTSFTAGRSGVSAGFSTDVIDENIQRLLASFVTVRAT